MKSAIEEVSERAALIDHQFFSFAFWTDVCADESELSEGISPPSNYFSGRASTLTIIEDFTVKGKSVGLR